MKKSLLFSVMVLIYMTAHADNPQKLNLKHPSQHDQIRNSFAFKITKAAQKSARAVPVAPEDGSIPLSKWFYSAGRVNDEQISQILKGTGVTPVSINIEGFAQDVMLFDSKGEFMVQTPPPIVKGMLDVTGEVFTDNDSPYLGDMELAHIDKNAAKAISPNPREMNYTFIEGGALITGRFEPSDPFSTYALVGSSAIYNLVNIYNWRKENKTNAPETAAEEFYLEHHRINKNNPFTQEEIKNMIASDLGIINKDGSPNGSHIIFVKSDKHLDLLAFPLPGGKILLNDSEKARDILYPFMPEETKLAIPIYTAPEIALKKSLEAFNAASKKYKFTIIPVAGNFATVGEKHRFNKGPLHVNFLNAVNIKTRSGRHIVLTNRARIQHVKDGKKQPEVRLTKLEEYWRHILLKHGGIEAGDVHFIGAFYYGNGAGIDCAGAVCP
ncbi:hypothetical protein Dip518_000156 [Parelusimicrobium proximum]|uniref:hypothetical protein n=1 Tax=Parelusimicrobium proximum TaxID=3228953 RepID=UPI003D16B2BE